PPQGRSGRPGFADVIDQIAQFWKNNQDKIREQAESVTQYLQSDGEARERKKLSIDVLLGAARGLERAFDSRHGGFGGAPKFPHPMDVRVLLRVWRRKKDEHLLEMVHLTLRKMMQGGIYDHLGGGFHRYAVDERWLVPHFEKMLYDNAMLAACYLEAFQATRAGDYARVVRETCDYVLREMTHAEGDFFSTQDADSEGEEGKFYVWTPAEVEKLVGTDAAKAFCYVYDVSPEGNFEGKSILNLSKTLAQCGAILKRDPAELEAELSAGRKRLFEARGKRVPPGLDDKVIVSWNGLMIDALAQAGAVLDEPRYVRAATAAADFILQKMRRPDGRLLHSWRTGQAKHDAYLDDYACLAHALVSVYEAGHDERFIDAAVALAETMLAHFADAKQGDFFYTADDHEQLIARQKDVQDNPVPSGNAMAATALLRLGKLCGRSDFLDAARATLETYAAVMERMPTATGQMLLALDMELGPSLEIVILGDPTAPDTRAVLRGLHGRYIPNKLVAVRRPGQASSSKALAGLFAGKAAQGHLPAAYICRDFTCQAPVEGREAILNAWAQLE
ncbi:MAG: thioredoxin domain-containing protein, partial [Planctomycetia bacterium]|nr:thioredoxin domain-containing protein [Planctomycetia bacterium]